MGVSPKSLAALAAVAVLLSGCSNAGSRAIDPEVAAAIDKMKTDPNTPRSMPDFIEALAEDGLIKTKDDVAKVFGSYAFMCVGQMMSEEFNKPKPTADDIQRTLNEKWNIPVTLDQARDLQPKLDRVCEDMKQHDES